jgi:hypothetical protein
MLVDRGNIGNPYLFFKTIGTHSISVDIYIYIYKYIIVIYEYITYLIIIYHNFLFNKNRFNYINNYYSNIFLKDLRNNILFVQMVL